MYASVVMTEKNTILPIRVECYAGYRGEESPKRFYIRQRQVDVIEILDRWLAPDHRYFKVKGDDRATYIIRHDAIAGTWELTLYDGRKS